MMIDISKKLRIAVLGDLGIDEYVRVRTSRLSAEGPFPVHDVVNVTGGKSDVTVPGLAANVRRQLKHWNVDARLFGCGTSLKRRYADETGRVLFRVDADTVPVKANRDAAVRALVNIIDQFDGVIISDYDKGTLDEPTIKAVIGICIANRVRVFVDPKHKPPEAYSACDVLKCNTAYYDRYGWSQSVRQVIVTQGGEPPKVYGEMDLPTGPPINVASVIGAGDSFLAAFACAYLRGSSIRDAASIAHSTGRVYVQRLFNEPVRPFEVDRDLDPIGGKIQTVESVANYLEGSVFTNGCFDGLHPGHLHTLQWAATHGKLIVGVNDDQSLRRLKGADRPRVPLEGRMMALASLAYVDVVIPFAEDTPVDLIRRLKPALIVKGPDNDPGKVPGREYAKVEIAPPCDFVKHTSHLSCRR